jgi:hypothetical protein
MTADETPIDATGPDDGQRETLTTADLAQSETRTGERPAEPTSFAEPEDKTQDRGEPLLAAGETGELRANWLSIQSGFVDEPRQAVEQADQLVAQAMKRLAEVFADERARLEGQWDRGGDVSTEDLRVALRRYRSFFERLLAI